MNQIIKFLPVYLILISSTFAQDVFNLWEGEKKPYYKENDLKEYEKISSFNVMCAYDITEPTITIYKAKGENVGKCVVIVPGGGYSLVAIYHEGYDIAKVLAEQGITAVVLKYRLPNPFSSEMPHLVPITDTRRALKLIREKAQIYGVNKDEVGLMGFSAGSHLATVVGLMKSEDKEENPNFLALIYGTTIASDINIKWLEESLYNRKMTPEEIAENNLIDYVTESSPATFLAHAYDDTECKIEESTLYAEKLVENNVLTEMHLFSKGGHGFGIGRKDDGTDQWLPLFINWLKNNNF